MGDDHFKVEEMGLYNDEFRTVEAGSIDKAILESPANGAEGVAFIDGVRFQWSAVDGAGSYTLEVAKDAAFTEMVASQSVLENSALVMNLEKATQYFWRVTAREAKVNGAYSVSEVSSFTTSASEDASFYESFRDFNDWEVLLDGHGAGGNPSNSTDQAHAGRYSFVMDEGNDAISKTFGTHHNDVVTVWLYDNMNTANAVAAVANVTTVGGPWAGLGVNVPTGASADHAGKTFYVIRDNGDWIWTEVERTEGWHELKWDYTDGVSCKMYIDGTLVHTIENAPYYDKIDLGDMWGHGGYPGDISGMYFDDLTVGDPVLNETVLSITVPDESIQLKIGETYQIIPVVETDIDVETEIEYIAQEYEIARASETGLVTAARL